MCEKCGCGQNHEHTHIVLPVSGMSCQHCSSQIEQALNNLPGVHATADHQQGCVSLLLHDNADLSQIKQVINDLGFEA